MKQCLKVSPHSYQSVLVGSDVFSITVPGKDLNTPLGVAT